MCTVLVALRRAERSAIEAPPLFAAVRWSVAARWFVADDLSTPWARSRPDQERRLNFAGIAVIARRLALTGSAQRRALALITGRGFVHRVVGPLATEFKDWIRTPSLPAGEAG